MLNFAKLFSSNTLIPLNVIRVIMASGLTNQQIDKIGNSIIYLSNRVGELTKTKILKLLFLLEEASIKKFGYPFFGVDFQLWVRGPVLKDIFIDLSEEDSPRLLKNYVKKSEYDDKIFTASRDFSDDEFSDNDVQLLDIIVKFAKHKTAKDLVNYTHGENSLWRKSAIKSGVLEQLENEAINSTDLNIDFSLLFEDNQFLKERYENAVENLEFIKHLKK